MWVGLDDTDSPAGGCTTWVLTELIRELPDLDLIGYPRLVRLNPNVPFKTRGNAALSARFGHGVGSPFPVGALPDRPLRAYAKGRALTPAEREALFASALSVLHHHSRWGEPGTDPALVVSPVPLPEPFYWRAVREVVEPSEAWNAVAATGGAWAVAYGDGRGIVGACAAIAWPARRRTWEAIAYRPRERWGTERIVDAASVRRMETRHPETFLSWDARTRRLLVTPHTACPILFGVRSKSPQALSRAVGEIRSERRERWVTFVTNQATGDHLETLRVADARPANSPVLTGHLVADPVVGRGGHVRFALEDGSGAIPCVVFEPSKTLGTVASRLRTGDRLKVWGSLPWDGEEPTLRVEGLHVLGLVAASKRVANPRCPSCAGPTSSVGSGKGYRCKRCRRKFPLESAASDPLDRRDLRGTHLPTPSARRHLSPLTLIRPFVLPGGRRP